MLTPEFLKLVLAYCEIQKSLQGELSKISQTPIRALLLLSYSKLRW